MLEHVRLHPCVITETAHTETEKHRYMNAINDIIDAQCIYLSLGVQAGVQMGGVQKREIFILIPLTSSTKLRAFGENVKRV